MKDKKKSIEEWSSILLRVVVDNWLLYNREFIAESELDLPPLESKGLTMLIELGFNGWIISQRRSSISLWEMYSSFDDINTIPVLVDNIYDSHEWIMMLIERQVQCL